VVNNFLAQQAHSSSLREFPSKQKTWNGSGIAMTPFYPVLSLIVNMIDALFKKKDIR